MQAFLQYSNLKRVYGVELSMVPPFFFSSRSPVV